MTDRLLTFECDDRREVVEHHMNRQGLDYLIEVLSDLRDAQPPEHTHLMTQAWGGRELSDSKQNRDYTLVQHVKLLKW